MSFAEPCGPRCWPLAWRASPRSPGDGVRARLGRGLDEVLVSVLTGPDRRADEAALVEAAAQV